MRVPKFFALRICTVCGEKYKPTQDNQITCQNFECKKVMKKRRANELSRERTLAKLLANGKKCVICGDLFMPATVIHSPACKKPSCSAEYKRLQAKKHRESYKLRHVAPRPIQLKRKNNDGSVIIPGMFDCPFSTLSTGIMGYPTFDDPQIDPFGSGWHHQAQTYKQEKIAA